MARTRFHRALRVLIPVLLVASCGAPPKPAPPPARVVTAPKPAVADPRKQLLEALRSIERPGGVLDALPAEQVTELTTRVSELSAAQREELKRGDDGVAELLPLLHLAAGGESPQALFALATTPRAAEQLRGETKAKIQLCAEVARRASLHFLRDRTYELAAPSSTTPALCRAVDQVATALGRRDLVRKNRELWVTLEATPAVWLRLAAARARDLDVRGAREALEQGRAGSGAPQVQRVVEAAARIAAPPPNATGLEPALARARDQIAVEGWAAALDSLAEFRSSAERHLGLAAALALAETKGSACPGLAPGVGSPVMCRTVWEQDKAVQSALARLGRAFDSKQGRDVEALDTYIGVSHIVPWIHATSAVTPAEVEAMATIVAPRLAALRAALAEAPHLSHVGVFVEALALGYQAALERKPGEPRRIAKADRDRLRASARVERSPVARLAAAAMLSGEEDVAELVLSSSAADLTLSQKLARAGLLAWIGSSGAHAEAVEPARAALAELVAELRDDDLVRAEVVLLLAEFDAARDPSERTHGVLAKVATELISGAVPPELGLRALLDAAGALAATGRKDDARSVLSRAQSIAPLAGSGLEVQALIHGYHTVLQADAGAGVPIPELKRALAALDGPSAPPSISLAFARWGKRLDAIEAESRCVKAKASNCSARAQKLLEQLPKAVTERVAPDTVALFQKTGVLRITRAGLRLGYTPETGISSEVSFAPSFLKLD